MIASEITDGQIDNVCAKLRDALRKHRKEITTEAAQFALGTENIGMMMFAPFREQAEMAGEMIVRRVRVKRNRTQQEMLDATGRVQYTNSEVVGLIPGKGESEKEEDVYFIPLNGKDTSAKAVQDLLDEHGLKPDGYAVAAVNEADPGFADSHPNATQWVDENGNHCYVTFSWWGGGERRVFCYRGEGGWDDDWSVGGVRK